MSFWHKHSHVPSRKNGVIETPFPIYVGWDSREDIAYQVCRHSLGTRATIPVSITPIKQQSLREEGLYTRDVDPLAATEFTYTRFFVPYLQGFKGWALFCDCDFLWLTDIAELVSMLDDNYAIMCVHHDHQPKENRKMDDRPQTQYPRKNWSSMVLYNCSHPANSVLTTDIANKETGAFLHRFQWLTDDLIGEIPESWNWLEGWSDKPSSGHPNAIHYTRGGPWFDEWQTVDYADLWNQERAAYEATLSKTA
jgi:lipopolysaccharide biosynthesis glycosyltransferase